MKNLFFTIKKENFGITLIALVITIVIILILAGVTLNLAIGDNGFFRMAEKTVDTYQTESEREGIEMSVATYQLGKNTNQEEIEDSLLGEALVDRGLEHQDDWHEVQTSEDSQWYGTGWNFLEKGKDFGFGELKNSWLVNYETGEIKKLEEGKYHSVTIHDTIAVEDNLILNLDSAMTDEGVDNTKSDIEERLGEGVTLNNFTFEDDGLINNEFVFDGENDYIDLDFDRIKIESDTERINWFSDGFTLEFYGTISGGKVKGIYDDEYGQDLGTVETEAEGARNSGILDCRTDKTVNGHRTFSFVVDYNNGTPESCSLMFDSKFMDEQKYGGDENSAIGYPYSHFYKVSASGDRRLLLYTFY